MITKEIITAEGQKMLAEKMKYTSEYAINFDDRIIQLYGDLTDEIGPILRVKYELLKQWVKNVEEVELTEITLDISSFGGDIYSIFSAFDFFHELKLNGVLVNTRAHGICMSAATVLLAGATGRRYALPYCRFMLHDVQVEGIGGTANQVQHTAKTISNEQMELFSFYAKFARKGQEDWTEKELKVEAKKWHKKYTKDGVDNYLTAKEVLELKLIDEIL